MRILITAMFLAGFALGCSGTKTEIPRAKAGEACKRGQGLGPTTSGNCEPHLICSPVKKVCVDDKGLRDELR